MLTVRKGSDRRVANDREISVMDPKVKSVEDITEATYEMDGALKRGNKKAFEEAQAKVIKLFHQYGYAK